MIKKRKVTAVEFLFDSSTLLSMWYSPKTKTLRVRFKVKDSDKYSQYRYLNVPPEIVEQVKKSSSQGMYFHSMIKGKYETKKDT
jgi:hypothetical protein